MHPLLFIRLKVFDLSQPAIGEACGVTPMAWSRWERGERNAPLARLQPILATMAAERGLPWSNDWLFRLPACEACPLLPDTVCDGGCARLVAQCADIRAGKGGVHGVAVADCDGAHTGNLGAAFPHPEDTPEQLRQERAA